MWLLRCLGEIFFHFFVTKFTHVLRTMDPLASCEWNQLSMFKIFWIKKVNKHEHPFRPAFIIYLFILTCRSKFLPLFLFKIIIRIKKEV